MDYHHVHRGCSASSIQEQSQDNNNSTVDVGDETILQPTTHHHLYQLCKGLASNLHLTVDVECGNARQLQSWCELHIIMADWSLCYIQYVLIDYWGDKDYLDPNFQIYFSSIHCVLQVIGADFIASTCYWWPDLT